MLGLLAVLLTVVFVQKEVATPSCSLRSLLFSQFSGAITLRVSVYHPTRPLPGHPVLSKRCVE